MQLAQDGICGIIWHKELLLAHDSRNDIPRMSARIANGLSPSESLLFLDSENCDASFRYNACALACKVVFDFFRARGHKQHERVRIPVVVAEKLRKILREKPENVT